ncbi:MFS transporter [Candidatus Uabimicrobium sp. HlEnr_7]|uniref:MFS transporter n=1 Tax=Candidatus Uabimicrobium helgolandensis TaxID=3095367 RepID=UPI00355671E5
MKIFSNSDVRSLFLGQVISQSGDSIFRIGLLWMVLELTSSKAITGAVAMASFLPSLLFSLPAGAIVDRFCKLRIMKTMDLLRFFLMLLIPICYFIGQMNIFLLVVITFLSATATTMFFPARDALIPEIVNDDELGYANTLIQTSWQSAVLLGPALGALLLYYVGQIHLFTANAVTFFVSFVAISCIAVPKKPFVQKNTSALQDMKEGMDYVLKTPLIRSIVLITVGNNLLLMGPAIVGIPIFVKEILHLNVEHYAWAEASLAGGIIIGVPIMAWISRNTKHMGKVLLWGLIFDGLTHCPLYFATTFKQTAITLFIHSIFIPMVTVSRTTLIQQSIPRELSGRIFSIIYMCVIGSTALSVSLTGLLAEYVAMNTIFLYSGILCASAGVWGFIFGIHRH